MGDDNSKISEKARQKLISHAETIYHYDRLGQNQKKEFIQTLFQHDPYRQLAGNVSEETLFLMYIYLSVEPAGGRFRKEKAIVYKSML